jgi:S-DNA-T family DNA segregation ATPase FtsK/SpoIIIE
VLGSHRDELVGLGIVVVAALVALACWFGAAGPAGAAVDDGLGAATGLARYVLPLGLAAVGIALVRDRRSESRTRLAIGGVLLALAVLGLLHLARGPETIDAPAAVLAEAGGWLGAAVGEPLRSSLGVAGAVVVLAAIGAGGAVILTRQSLRDLAGQMARGVRAGAEPAVRGIRRAASDISTLADRSDDLPARGGPPVVLYDQAAEEDTAQGSKPRRSRKRDTADNAAAGPPAGPGAVPGAGGPTGQLAMDLGPGIAPGQWKLPSSSPLHRTGAQSIDKDEVQRRGRQLEEALASHGVETRLVGMTVGPTVTRYELELGAGVKVARVTSLSRDIAYALAATDVRILAPIPGRSAIGVEVPNHTRHLVALGDLLSSPEAKAATHPLEVALGKDIAGRPVFLNLATTPHLLVAGATGAGKSSAINCIITSLLMRTTPEQVRLILVDPKQVEMGQYARLPHLLTQPVTNPKKAANALAWAVKEMERRYDLLFEVGFRDITGYNAAWDRGELRPEPAAAPDGGDPLGPLPESLSAHADGPHPERLPYIVVVVDELNDLMMVAARDVEESITRIAQKARAVGIHLIVATQRPSVNVITGVIKANVPARMAFAVSSLTDSRVILDQPGAERLVGKGDMLLLPGNTSVAQRIQGAWVSEEEVRTIVAHWRRQAPEPVYVHGVEGDDGPAGERGSGGFGADDDDDDALVHQARELVVRSQLGSTSMLQRKLKVGFARAGRIMDLLEQRGVVGPSEGSKARAVLMTPEELDLIEAAEQLDR